MNGWSNVLNCRKISFFYNTNTAPTKIRDRHTLHCTRWEELSIPRDFGRDAVHTRKRTKLEKRSPSPKKDAYYSTAILSCSPPHLHTRPDNHGFYSVHNDPDSMLKIRGYLLYKITLLICCTSTHIRTCMRTHIHRGLQAYTRARHKQLNTLLN